MGWHRFICLFITLCYDFLKSLGLSFIVLTHCNKRKPLILIRYYLVTGVTILLSLTVFMMIVSETLPATSEAIPLIGR